MDLHDPDNRHDSGVCHDFEQIKAKPNVDNKTIIKPSLVKGQVNTKGKKKYQASIHNSERKKITKKEQRLGSV